ncbi:MAG: peptidase S9 [Gemmatimonadota bacterium]|jgi:Tol biopolymer transport system component|nr:peptidase S9 [Gemmatimonadota bacterium]
MDRFRTRPARATLPLLLVLGALAAIPDIAAAQYFGRNQVQYRTFDFRVRRTENFDMYFYPETENAIDDVSRMAERWYSRLSTILDHRFEERQPVIMYANHPHFQQTTVVAGIGEGTGGVTEAYKQRVVLPFSYSYEETDHVLGHELVHAFQYDISGLGRAGGGIEAAARRFQVPLWFIEGMAEYLSVGPVDPHTAMWLRDGALRGELPSIERMTYDPRIFPYRWGQALWAYVGGRWGDAAIGQILKLTGQGVPYPTAFERVLNTTLEELSGDWHASIRRSYLPMLADRPEAREIAEGLITGERRGGSLNIAPVLSPDGQWVVFLSELDNLDVEIHLANARTGEVVRTLQKGTAFDPHFGSIRYISSAGTWSPDNQQFAFSALREGHDVLAFVEVARGRRLREIAIPGVDEISNPSWSPDGRTIAFSGLAGGSSHLYVVDLQTEEVTQLTTDRHAVLHPTYSPDGRSIAFTTDAETDFELLSYGPYQLAIMDVATRRIRIVPGVQGPKAINPQWTADGMGLYYIANPNGIPNIYRVDIETGQLHQITDLFTGVSGITDTSPAMTVSRNGERLLFTEYSGDGYNIFSISDRQRLQGTEIEHISQDSVNAAVRTAGMLPPVPRPTEGAFNRVSEMLANPTSGLPTRTQMASWEVVPYRPRLQLDYLGQPQVGVSVGGGAFGSGGLYGGIYGSFSDILARHEVFAAIQAQGQLDEIGFAVQYLNMRERWNFGGAAQRVPQVYGGYAEFYDPANNRIIQSIERYRFFDSSIQGFTQYPFSVVQRAEFSAGLRRVSRDVQVNEYFYDASTGNFLGDNQQNFDGLSLNFFETTAALVYDNSLTGYTSPFAGQRYRFQVSPTFGQLQFVQLLGDYRKYFFMRPFTLAVRGLHTGRYGQDSEAIVDGQTVFADAYLGQPWYVRGYNSVYRDCQNTQAADNCNLLRNLLGSRIAVTSAELRFPLVRQAVLSGGIGFPPIEGLVFGDAGIAWDRNSSPLFQTGVPINPDERGIITSAGVGARINVLGMIIVEVNYLRAFNRPEPGWRWAFNFTPGF